MTKELKDAIASIQRLKTSPVRSVAPMTDLAARIADVKKKAEAAKLIDANWLSEYDLADAVILEAAHFIVAANPDLFLAMASRIEELEKALEPFALAASTYDKCKPTRPMRFVWEFDKTLEVGHLRTAARALRGEG